MRAVMVICEGRSDVAFVRRSLIAISACRRCSGEIRDLPSPFGVLSNKSRELSDGPSDGVISEHIKDRFGKKGPEGERKLRDATFLQPPHFEDAIWDRNESVIYFLVNAGGGSQHVAVTDLVERVDASMLLDDLDITECAFAFLFDADERGEAAAREHFCNHYCDFFECDDHFDKKNWVRTRKFPVGLFIWRDAEGKGALEEHIIPMIKSTWPKRFKDAYEFIDKNRNSQWRDKVFQTRTNMQKAIIASVGQFSFPGESSLSVIYDDRGIPDSEFETSDSCSAVVMFLQDVPWAGDQ